MFRPIRRTVANDFVRAGFFLLPPVAFVLPPTDVAAPPRLAVSALLKAGQRGTGLQRCHPFALHRRSQSRHSRGNPESRNVLRVKISSRVGSVSRRNGLSL